MTLLIVKLQSRNRQIILIFSWLEGIVTILAGFERLALLRSGSLHRQTQELFAMGCEIKNSLYRA
jgi:hypothetical protein